ncbi:hypothetical protein SLS64_011514 [Diaporthe eres]|uniref:Cell wall protein PhiA n=1 Tax=Diaporthe eres TaxID=83184 RepID=A0ABR1P010_DIAER
MHFVALPLLFGLLATSHAVPSLPKRSLSETPPPRSSEFSLAMKLGGVNGTYAPLNAVYLEDRGLLLRATNATDAPGSPVYVNSTDSDDDYFPDALNLDLTDSPDVSAPPGVYGLFVSDPGDAHGLSSYVFGTIDEQQFDFHVADGFVYHKLTAAPQSWFACEDIFENVTGVFLSWGVYETNYSAPPGCEWTEVIQNFNLTARATLAWA